AGTRSSIETSPRPTAAAGTDGFLPGVNLLIDLAGLTRLLAHELQDGSGLDAFLLAAGINQILEDHLHRDHLQLRKFVPHLRRLPRPLGPTASVAARTIRRFGIAFRRLDGRERRALGVQRRLSVLVRLLATALVDQAGADRNGGLAAEVLAD